MFLGSPIGEALVGLSKHGILRVEYASLSLIMSSTDEKLKIDYLNARDAGRLKGGSIPTSEIREVASSLGMSPIQIHSPEFDLGSFDEGRRMLAVDKTSTMLEICSELGSPCLIIHLGAAQPTMSTYTNYVEGIRRRSIKSIKALVHQATDLGVKIAVENRWQNLYGSKVEDLIDVVEHTDPDYVIACLDTGHCHRLGLSPSHMVRRLGNHLGTTHIHDNDGSSDQHLPPFSGGIDWEGFASSLRKVGYKGPLMGEIQGSADPVIGQNRLLLSKLAMGRLLDLLDLSCEGNLPLE